MKTQLSCCSESTLFSTCIGFSKELYVCLSTKPHAVSSESCMRILNCSDGYCSLERDAVILVIFPECGCISFFLKSVTTELWSVKLQRNSLHEGLKFLTTSVMKNHLLDYSTVQSVDSKLTFRRKESPLKHLLTKLTKLLYPRWQNSSGILRVTIVKPQVLLAFKRCFLQIYAKEYFRKYQLQPQQQCRFYIRWVSSH